MCYLKEQNRIYVLSDGIMKGIVYQLIYSLPEGVMKGITYQTDFVLPEGILKETVSC